MPKTPNGDSEVAAQAIDELLANATPTLLLDLAKALPLRATTVANVHRSMQANCARLAQEMR